MVCDRRKPRWLRSTTLLPVWSLLEPPGRGGDGQGGPALSAPLALGPSKAPTPHLGPESPCCVNNTASTTAPGQEPDTALRTHLGSTWRELRLESGSTGHHPRAVNPKHTLLRAQRTRLVCLFVLEGLRTGRALTSGTAHPGPIPCSGLTSPLHGGC